MLSLWFQEWSQGGFRPQAQTLLKGSAGQPAALPQFCLPDDWEKRGAVATGGTLDQASSIARDTHLAIKVCA